jgi:hypothetical protein
LIEIEADEKAGQVVEPFKEMQVSDCALTRDGDMEASAKAPSLTRERFPLCFMAAAPAGVEVEDML